MAKAQSGGSEWGSVGEWRATQVFGDFGNIEKIRQFKSKHDTHPVRAKKASGSLSSSGFVADLVEPGKFAEPPFAFHVARELCEFSDEKIVVPVEVEFWGTIGSGDYDVEPEDVEVRGSVGSVSWANVDELLKDAKVGREFDYRPVIDVMPRRETALQQEYEKRRRQDRDMKVIIYARDGQTGTGKTSLAVHLAKAWDANGWDAEKATLDPSEYVERWHEVPEGSVLLADEAEQQADSRRSMSKQNLSLTHAWATLRYQQVFSVLTLPDPTYLDVRLRKGADFHIVVHERGRAVVYRSKIEDQSGDLYQERAHMIHWDAVDDDPDYRELNRLKAERMEDYQDSAYYEDDDSEALTEEDMEKARIEGRNDVIRQMAAAGETHESIAQTVGLSRSAVSKIVSDE